METLEYIDCEGNTRKIAFVRHRHIVDGGLSIDVLFPEERDEETAKPLFASLTAHFSCPIDEDIHKCAFVNVGDFGPGVVGLLEREGLAKATETVMEDGCTVYPLMEFTKKFFETNKLYGFIDKERREHPLPAATIHPEILHGSQRLWIREPSQETK